MWTRVQNYSATNTYVWPADGPPGNYQLEVDLRPAGSSVSYTTYTRIPFMLTGCSGALTLQSAQSSPQPAGTVIHWTASQACSGTPNYEFYVKTPSGVWTRLQNWGTSNTFDWTTPSVLGNYVVEVDSRNAGAINDPYDSFTQVTFTVGLCSTPTLSTGAASSPYATGTGAITLTGGGNCTGGTTFAFYIQNPAGVWTRVQTYSPTNTYTWSADGSPGTYMLEVDLRPVGSSLSYVTYTRISFVLTGCTTAPVLNSDFPTGTTHTQTITFTATGGSCTGTAPWYAFYIRNPAGVWTRVQAYSATNTYVWSSHAAGAWMIEADVINANANNDPYDSYTRILST